MCENVINRITEADHAAGQDRAEDPDP